MNKQINKSSDISYLDFIKRAIVNLRNPGYKGIHSVFSGFNSAFAKFYPNANVIDETRRLAEAGQIVIIPAKRGVMLYLPSEAPKRDNSASVEKTLDKILSV